MRRNTPRNAPRDKIKLIDSASVIRESVRSEPVEEPRFDKPQHERCLCLIPIKFVPHRQ